MGLTVAFDVARGFNPGAGRGGNLGWITSLTIGDKVLPANLNIVGEGAPYVGHAVAVLAGLSWDLGRNDPVRFEAFVDEANHALLRMMMLTARLTTMTPVVCGFAAYEYEAGARHYAPVLAPTAPAQMLSGTLYGKVLHDPEIVVAEEAGGPVADPPCYAIGIAVAPTMEGAQNFSLKVGDRTAIKGWGMDVASVAKTRLAG